MSPFTRVVLLAVLLISSAPFLIAEISMKPVRHWQGLVHMPGMEIRVAVDVRTLWRGAGK